MLESLHIENFQKHQRIELTFDPLVTTLCGRTNAGKSSILRCLRWVSMNQPRGDDFIRHGVDQAVGTLKVDSHTIKRVRGGGKNEYHLDDKSFVSFNNEVPEPIAALLNMGAVNFQRQLDGPFWLELTPGEVSRELNAVVDLACIDQALSTAATQVRSANSELEFTSKRLEQAREERDKLQFVQELDEDLQKLEEVDKELATNRLKSRQTGDLLKWGRGLEGELDRLSRGILTQGKAITALEDQVKQLEEEKRNYSSIQKLLKEGREKKHQVQEAQEKVAELEAELNQLGKEICLECGRPLGELK